jgi:hypothetical protein
VEPGDTLSQLQELMETQEELDPELEAYREVSEQGWDMIRHPLVYSVLHVPQMNALVNAQLKAKKKAMARAVHKRDWHSYVFLHEKPYRIDAFAAVCGRIGDSRYWELLGDIWTNTENMWQNQQSWTECLTAARRYRSHMMTAEERGTLNLYPARGIPVYRGFSVPGGEVGLSWTVNKTVAKFFACRLAELHHSPRIAAGFVDRRNVIAYFNGRDESEVVVLPNNVRDISITEVGCHR